MQRSKQNPMYNWPPAVDSTGLERLVAARTQLCTFVSYAHYSMYKSSKHSHGWLYKSSCSLYLHTTAPPGVEVVSRSCDHTRATEVLRPRSGH
ncbi:hypothetical protein NP493_1294g01038 [Ridgeia piscesae]|uniref:Uncharacterized protein n=1 Tax=Ridgeia piscesae TaxID=27915 RepID=A0AAD9KAP2_RIDPI|nr:hypothetical protein NP493_1294g01038 [Ridgeia piscesae]